MSLHGLFDPPFLRKNLRKPLPFPALRAGKRGGEIFDGILDLPLEAKEGVVPASPPPRVPLSDPTLPEVQGCICPNKVWELSHLTSVHQNFGIRKIRNSSKIVFLIMCAEKKYPKMGFVGNLGWSRVIMRDQIWSCVITYFPRENMVSSP